MEAPHLSRLAEEYKDDGLIVLGVNAWDEEQEDVRRFVEENKLKQRILMNGRDVGYELYHVPGIPTVLWISRNGVVVYTELGYDDPKELEQNTKKLLARSG